MGIWSYSSMESYIRTQVIILALIISLIMFFVDKEFRNKTMSYFKLIKR